MTPETKKQKLRPLVLALQTVLATGTVLPVFPVWGVQTTRVSVSSLGIQGNGSSFSPSLSADGRYIAFSSNANNLVLNDTNRSGDVFVRDLLTKRTTLVSVNSQGVQCDLGGGNPSISADGRYIAFVSFATNLVVGDTNGTDDIFVRDLNNNKTTRVSISSTGIQGNSQSYWPSISANGRYVVFVSGANNLVLNDTNNSTDIFVRDRLTNLTTRISVDSEGNQGNSYNISPSISGDGRFVAFTSGATNLVPNDTNLRSDIFVHDRATHQTTRVSVSNSNVQGNGFSFRPSISADGKFVIFLSTANNLVTNDNNLSTDVFVHDRTTKQTTRVSLNSSGVEGNNNSGGYSISADGRFIAFNSIATNLIANDSNGFSDIFVRDRTDNKTTRVSISSTNSEGNSGSLFNSLSADGRFVAFDSNASNLVGGDTNIANDIFVHDRFLNSAVTADLAITQTLSPNPVTVGANFTYTATIRNQGPGNAANVVLTDYVPLDGKAGLPSLLPSQGSCTKSSISICRLGTLNAGQQATVKMTFTAKRQGIVFNRVTVSAAPKDPTPFNSVTTQATINP